MSSIREILTDQTFSSNHIIPDASERRETHHEQIALKRQETLKRAQSSRAESRRGRIESISMMMGDNSPLTTPSRPHRRSMRGSFQKINRNDEAAGNLYELMKGTEFFKQLPRKVGIEVCRHIGYKSMSKGGLLFRESEIGLSVYFILSGSVKVYLPEKGKEAGAENGEDEDGAEMEKPKPPPKPKVKKVIKRRKIKKKKEEEAEVEATEGGEGAEEGAEGQPPAEGATEEKPEDTQDPSSPKDASKEEPAPSSAPGSEGEAESDKAAAASDDQEVQEEKSADSPKEKEGPEEEEEAVATQEDKGGDVAPTDEAEAQASPPEPEKEEEVKKDSDSKTEAPTEAEKEDGEADTGDKEASEDTPAAADDETENDQDATESDLDRKDSSTDQDGELASDEEWEYYEVEEEEPENYGRFIVELYSPSMFGELALLRESPRTATVVCEPNTELMELERHDFDRIFRRMGNVVFMPERLKEILSVPPKLRAEENNNMALGRHKFLQNLDKDIAAQLIGKLTLSVIQENELIFRQGEVGSQFYIILTGKVHIFVDRRPKKEEVEEQKAQQEPIEEEDGDDKDGGKKKNNKKKGRSKSKSPDKKKKGHKSPERNEPGDQAPKQGFEESAIISETIYSGQGDRMVAPADWEEVLGMKKQTLAGGDSFGDRALLQKNTLRTASCIAAEKTEIMVLSQADFKKLFAKDSNEVEGFERVAELLQIDSGARSKDQLDELAQLLTKTSSFFQTLDPGLHYDICQAASYKRLQSNDVVFVQGEVGDAFYVVLRGTLSLHIKGTPGLPPPKKEPKEPTGDEEEGYEEPEDLTEVYGPCISVLSGGQSFGELALLHGMPRTGTVLCQDESELLVLWKANYDEILQTSQARELERQVAFLRNLPNLDNLSTGRLVRIAYCFQLKELSRGYTLLQEGKTSEKGHIYVYIVKEGAIKMVRRTNMKKLAGAFHASVAPSARLSICPTTLGCPLGQRGGLGAPCPREGTRSTEQTVRRCSACPRRRRSASSAQERSAETLPPSSTSHSPCQVRLPPPPLSSNAQQTDSRLFSLCDVTLNHSDRGVRHGPPRGQARGFGAKRFGREHFGGIPPHEQEPSQVDSRAGG